MNATVTHWDDLPTDQPIALLTRTCLVGEQMLLARVFLEKGCHVARHRHSSEQISVLISGKVEWTLNDDQTKLIVVPGQVVFLPGNAWHEVVALEDSEIIDILSPPCAMGVDAQQD